MDGRPASESQPVPIPVPGSTPASGPPAEQAYSGPKKAGKLMYRDRLAAKFAAEKRAGSGAAAAPQPPPPSAPSETKEGDVEAAPGFKAFQGKGRSLKD